MDMSNAVKSVFEIESTSIFVLFTAGLIDVDGGKVGFREF